MNQLPDFCMLTPSITVIYPWSCIVDFPNVNKKRKSIELSKLLEINERLCVTSVFLTSGKSFHEVWCLHHDKGAHPQAERKGP